ncbi:hypothetical protein FQZ97_765670 [compost metagenome]
MVDVAVVRLVGAHHQHHVAQGGVVAELPVAFGDVGRGSVGCAARVDLGQVLRVADHRFFFKVAHQAVRRAARDEIQRKETEVEDPLRKEDEPAFQHSGSGDLDEGHQVHALVFCFFHQGADPAFIVDHAAQGMQMGERGAHHARHGRHRLQHDGAVAVTFGKERIRKKSQQLRHAPCEVVAGGAGRVVQLGVVNHGSPFGWVFPGILRGAAGVVWALAHRCDGASRPSCSIAHGLT